MLHQFFYVIRFAFAPTVFSPFAGGFPSASASSAEQQTWAMRLRSAALVAMAGGPAGVCVCARAVELMCLWAQVPACRLRLICSCACLTMPAPLRVAPLAVGASCYAPAPLLPACSTARRLLGSGAARQQQRTPPTMMAGFAPTPKAKKAKPKAAPPPADLTGEMLESRRALPRVGCANAAR